MAQLAEHLLARGHHVLAVAEEHAGDAPGEHVVVRGFGLTRSQRERQLARKLVAAAREHRADVTIGCRHLYECDLYWPHGGAHAIAYDQSRRARGARVLTPPSGRHVTFIEFERELLERGGARAVVCVSSMVQAELAALYPACRERLRLIPNGVDLQRYRPELRATAGAQLRNELGLGPQTPLIAFAARNPVLKGFKTLVQACDTLARKHGAQRDWHVLAAGFERGEARDLGASEDVHVRPFVDAATLWSAADLCAQPTWRDAGGLAILEALACGTPVITTLCDGSSEVVAHHAGTVLERPGDFTALQAAIETWLERIHAGSIDRTAIRACVETRDSRRWLAELERLVLELGGGDAVNAPSSGTR